jgi:CRP-like cAMP-binding protein
VQFSILGSLSEADRRRVLASTSRRRFARREMLFHEEDPGDTLHLIEKGRVAVRITTRAGEQATIDVLGGGDVVGTFAALGVGHRRAASVLALEPTETLAIDRVAFQALRRAHPTIDQFVIDVLLADVRRVDTLLLEALFAPVEHRLLRRLIDLTVLYGRDGDVGGPVEIALTQQDLASLAGTSRATANRVLRELEVAGILRLTRNRIHVVDVATLRKRAR